MEKREKKLKIQKKIFGAVMLLYFAFCGGVGGFLIIDISDAMYPDGGEPKYFAVLAGILPLACILLGYFIHIYLHECGHLIFGLISGYKFQSIRFGSLIIYASDNGLKFGKYTLAGTGGQCLMTPPDVSDEELPTDLYNWGGLIVNIVLIALGVAIYFIAPDVLFIHLFNPLFVLIGLFFLLLNGIPFESLSNDGYNAIHLKKDIKDKRAFKIQLLMSGELAKNHPSTGMPAEWFDWEYEEGDSGLAASHGVVRLGWLVSMKRFEEAYLLSENLIKNVKAIADVHQTITYSENLCCKIWLGKEKEEIKADFEKNKKKFQVLKQFPSIQRTLYLYYSHVAEDEKLADKAKADFEKIAKKYPYPCEIDIERELMDTEVIALEKENN